MKRNVVLVKSSLFFGIKKSNRNLVSLENFDEEEDIKFLTRQAEYSNSNLVRQVSISSLNINWHNTVNLTYSILEKEVFSYKGM